MMRQHLIEGAPRRVVMLNGSSYVDELGYRDLLEGWQRDGTYPLTYVPTISRASDPRNAGWEGRTGRVEGIVLDVCRDLELRPEQTVVYICGNPDMIINVEELLMGAGFPEFHVKKELYWPKGKTVPGAEAAACAGRISRRRGTAAKGHLLGGTLTVTHGVTFGPPNRAAPMLLRQRASPANINLSAANWRQDAPDRREDSAFAQRHAPRHRGAAHRPDPPGRASSSSSAPTKAPSASR